MRTASPGAEASAAAERDLVDLVYEAVTDRRAWPEVLARLRCLLAAEAVLLARHDVATGSGTFLHEVGLDPGLVARYETEFADKNPWMQAERLYLTHHVVTGEDVLPNADLMRTEFYHEYLRPQDLLHRLCGVVWRRESEFFYLTAVRRPAQPVFGDSEKRGLARLLPHVRRVLALSWELAGERSARHALLDVLDQLPTALIVVDAEAHPIMVNAAAERILAMGDGMLVNRQRLEALWHPERVRLAQLIASACAFTNGDPPGAGGHLKITRPSGFRPFLVTVTPLPRTCCDRAGRRGRIAAIIIKDPQAEPQASTAKRRGIAELYELTPAEERLLDHLLDGSGLFEAAQRLGITRNTARTHMKRIYAKTGTNRQADLVRRLAHLTIHG